MIAGAAKQLFLIFILILLAGAETLAVTVTVGPTNFISITPALEAINYNDGQDDVILIGPGVYDEQLTPKGHAGVNSVRYPDAFEMTAAQVEAAYTSHTDHLTFRGIDPNNPPILTYINGADNEARPYGMFPENPVDYFFAGIVLCGNNVTFENVEIRHGNTDYGINGQARGIVFRDVLFTNGLPGNRQRSSFWAFNNNIGITSHVRPQIAADNEYLLQNCVFDGLSKTGDGSFHNNYGIYFHGYGQIPGKPATDEALYGYSHFEGCVFRNWDDWMITSTHQAGMYYRGLSEVRVEDCFSDNVRQLLRVRGHIQKTIVARNLFRMGGPLLTAAPGMSTLRAVEITQRQSAIPRNVYIAHNIFTGESEEQSLRLHMETSTAAAPQVCDWHVVNNTFHGYEGPAISVSGAVTRADSSVKLNIANNIFHGSGESAVGVDYTATGANTTTLLNNGFFQNQGGDVVGEVDNQDAVFGDPEFDGVTPYIPPHPSWGAVQQFNPMNYEFRWSGHRDSYNVITAVVGDADIDRTNSAWGGSIALGAQQFDHYRPPTPTFTPSLTPTPTPSQTPDFDLEPDEVVNVKDLLLLLGGIRKGEDAAIDLFEFSAYWGN